MGKLQSLVKDTAIYGMSSIIGRFLNYLLVPLYTHKMNPESGDYGDVTNVYAWTAILLVFLTFGFETTFFRFASKEKANVSKVFSMSMQVIGVLCGLFLLGVMLSAVSMVGDLIASLIKRHYKIKDYSHLFPGHGGVLDRFDSVLATAPMTFIVITVFTRSPLFFSLV